ncbi:hypothetical protein TrLO_g9985 [Triparma laevis f. longispina]|uniref:Cilia- and flagella-associated protein 206 n=2 Tax=Triparma laevis TaxID=1534972 RepID=A0A9W7AVX2_9STRA|nr:hypothetical protein TrLO_g9985 [Triparma laevis f. longispina]
MDEIEEVVGEIVRGCSAQKVQCSELLAAFVARTILESDAQTFALEKELNDEDVNSVINLSVERLLEKDSPSLETIKMQVAFDSSHVMNEEAVASAAASVAAKKRELQKTIISTKLMDANDFDSLTALYREIFSLLTKTRSSEEYPESVRRSVEREVAAAVESVFPRIGLKSFVQLSSEEKKLQLEELASIVNGIRLFNKEAGKGGAGLESFEVSAPNKVSELSNIISGEIDSMNVICQEYQEVIVFSNLRKPAEVTEYMIQRWKDELANRRQYLSYLQSLFEDVSKCGRKISFLRESYLSELDDLSSMVGSRNSVPKEHVYPKFDKIAQLWKDLGDELSIVSCRESTLNDLVDYKSSFTLTLNSDSQVLSMARDAPTLSTEEEEEAARAAVIVTGVAEPKEEGKEGPETTGDVIDLPKGTVPSDLLPPNERPVCLSIDSTPEFMQLPLEYQGFCPWTIYSRSGLLLPGKPALGVVQFSNSFFVFAHEVALQGFLDDPVKYVEGVKGVAMRNPELIHLLRLQRDFPNTAIAKLMGTQGGAGPAEQLPLGFEAPTTKVDASTETPVHFIEKNIDPSYSWNEWTLRKRALQLANLKKCKTSSQQTDESHMRRENDSQVYLPRTKSTMTKTSTGTNVDKRITYVKGLRGEGVKGGIVGMSLEIKETVNVGQSSR